MRSAHSPVQVPNSHVHRPRDLVTLKLGENSLVSGEDNRNHGAARERPVDDGLLFPPPVAAMHFAIDLASMPVIMNRLVMETRLEWPMAEQKPAAFEWVAVKEC